MASAGLPNPAFALAAITANGGSMIIVCPNCGARYRIDPAVAAAGSRMRCAECQHRWVPDMDAAMPAVAPVTAGLAPEALEFGSVVPEVAAVGPGAGDEPAEATDVDPADTDVDDNAQPAAGGILRSIFAVVLGGGLAVAAAALWLGDRPLPPPFAAALAALQPAPLALRASARAIVTVLPSGERLLEIAGRVENHGLTPARLTAVDLRLSGPHGIVRRWRVALPATPLAPGESLGFATSTTGFAAGDRSLSMTPRG